jgi:phosphopentomutase
MKIIVSEHLLKMTRAELVEQAKSLGIKYIAKKNMKDLAEEIAQLQGKKISPKASPQKSKAKAKAKAKSKAKLTYHDGRKYAVYVDEPNTYDDLTDDERDLHYNGKRLDVYEEFELQKVVKASKTKQICDGQLYSVWYDEKKDVFVNIYDIVVTRNQKDISGWQAWLVKLGEKRKIVEAKPIKEDLNEEEDEDLPLFMEKLKGKKRYLEVYID